MYRTLKDIKSMIAVTVFIIAMLAACTGGAGVASNPKPGHWEGESVSFDLMPNGAIRGFKLAADMGSGTCAINLDEFEKQSDGAFAFGDPASTSQTALYITGKFAADTAFSGVYKISVCTGAGGQYSVSLVAKERPYSAAWVSDVIATEEPTSEAQPSPAEIPVLSQPVRPSAEASASGRTVTLAEAIDQGLVEAELTGTGYASGGSISLKVRQMVSDPLTITIEPGIELLNSSSSEQNMVVRKLLGVAVDSEQYLSRDVIALPSFSDTYLVEAYCLDIHKDNPTSSSGFSIGDRASDEVLAVLNALEQVPGAGTATEAVQSAIWAMIDDVTWEELTDLGYDPDHDLVRSIIAAAGYDPDCNALFGKVCDNSTATTATPPDEPKPTPTPRPTISVLDSQTNRFFSPGPAPAAVAITDDAVWVVDRQQHRIYQLDRSGTQLGSFPLSTQGDINGLAWDGEALRVLVNDYGTGNQIMRLNPEDKKQSALVLPVDSKGLAWDSTTNSFWTIANESSDGFLLQFDADGTLLRTLSIPVFGSAEALAVAPDGLWVLSVFGRWQRFSFDGEYLSSGELPVEVFAGRPGLAWDPQGYLWLTADNQREIYQYAVTQAEIDTELPPEMQSGPSTQKPGELPLPAGILQAAPGKNNASVHITNRLSVPLNLSLDSENSEDVHESVVVAPGETWTATIPQGVYAVFASANASTPIAFSGKVLLLRGYDYTWAMNQ